MKKFDIKKLLILLLAIMLAFALVACNKGGGSDEEEDEEDTSKKGAKTFNSAAFIEEMFTAASSIGKEEVDTSKFFTLKLGLMLDVAIGSDSLNADIDATLYLDGAEISKEGEAANLGKSAVGLAVKLDFATLDLFFFIENPEELFIRSSLAADPTDVFKLPINLDAVVGEGDSYNAVWSTALAGFLKQDLAADNADIDSVWSIVKMVADSFGSDYTLDTTLNQVLKIAGLDLGKLLGELKAGNAMVGSILEGLEINPDDKGNYSLKGILLTLNELNEFETPTAITGGYEMKVLSGNLIDSMVHGIIANLFNGTPASGGKAATDPILGGALKGLYVGGSTEVNLGYTANADKEIDTFYLKLKLPSSTTLDETTELKITIDELELKNTTATAYEAVGVAKADCDAAEEAQLQLGKPANGETKVVIDSGLFTINYAMDSTAASWISEIQGATAAKTWGIIGTDGLYYIQPGAVSFNLAGTYTATDAFAKVGIDGTDYNVIGGKLVLGEGEELIFNLNGNAATVKIKSATADGKAAVAAKYIAQLIGMILANDSTELAVHAATGFETAAEGKAYNDKVIDALVDVNNVFATAKDADGYWTINLVDVLCDNGIIELPAEATFDFETFIANAILGAIAADEKPETAKAYFVVGDQVFEGAVLTGSGNIEVAVPAEAAAAADTMLALYNANEQDITFAVDWGFDTFKVGDAEKKGVKGFEGYNAVFYASFKDTASYISLSDDNEGIVVKILNAVGGALAGGKGNGFTLTVANLDTFMKSFLGENYMDGLHDETDVFVGALLAGSAADSVSELLAGSAKITLNKDKLEIEYANGGKKVVLTTGLKLVAAE